MAKQCWVITDVARGIALDELTLTSGVTSAVPKGVSITKRTLHGGLQDGVDVVDVDNGRLRFTVIPTRGMGVWRAWCDNIQLGWQAPVHGPVHPKWVNLWEPSGLGWLDGFDELLVRCGLESNGAPEFDDKGILRYPLHGKIANRPACRVEVSMDSETGNITVRGEVYETRLFFTKLKLATEIRTTVGACSLTVTDTVTNVAAVPGEMELLYHINFGPPVLEPGSKVTLPIQKLAPRDPIAAAEIDRWDQYGPESPGKPETAYFVQPLGDGRGQTLALLHNEAGTNGVRVDFNIKELPCFTLWKNEQPVCDGYVTGLEPGVNFPNRRSFEKAKGRVVTLQPGEARRFTVEITALVTSDAVSTAREEILRLQTQAPPEVLRQPCLDWSP
ncbi:MAG: aldose 1-epimerase family protein [Thermogutta sp.]|nr:aldose 1-epimerase family protein [Thermogutta sp.]HPU06429.1 aldose 1-epimerase family protein [Thermogutta sp.]